MAWVVLIAAIASISYAANLGSRGAPEPDIFFRWGTAIGTFVLDGILLLITLFIVRGLPLREALALRRPPSWSNAIGIALAALAAVWTTSLVLELTVGHAAREQAVPEFFDATRLAPLAANFVAVALFVPIVEESLCRGVGFYLLEPWGPAVAVGGSALAFALAHGAVLDLPWVLVTGVGLGYLRLRTGSLYPCVGLHATVNGIAIAASALIARG